MFHVRSLPWVLKLAALWLLVVSVFLGPAEFGGAVAFASVSGTSACGVSCPCDEDSEAVPCDHDNDDRAEADQGVGEPCQDGCPEDCPDCGCCRGVALAVFPVVPTSSVNSCASARLLSPVSLLASGSCTGVFRPPRSLT